jgi:[acyl-carrier-protein] S-malonyltransferase
LSTAILFPGQGAQTVGMGNQLVRDSARAKERFAQAEQILGFDLHRVCSQGPSELLGQTQYSQPALFTHSYAAIEILAEERPDLWDSVVAVAGLSLGEYTAVAAAGGLSFEDGLKVVKVRGQAMQAAADLVESGMSSILGLSLEQVQDICQQATLGPESFVQPANLLCPGNIAVSGHLDALARVESLATDLGAMRAVRLQVAGAFHTSIMQSAIDPLVRALDEVNFGPTRVPVYSNVDACPHSQPEEFRQLLPTQVVSPVLWEETVKRLIAEGVERFIEVGVGRVLTGTIKRIHRKIPCENFGELV